MMADKHSLNYDVRELKLGSSFTNNKASQYHTIKYDFKPASVDVNKMATVSVGTKNEVTVTVPHLVGAGVPQTVFKGNQKPYTKECVLIIDKVTGEITLEKLSSNIQVKKTRQETAQKPRPLTPVTADFTNTTQRSTSRTRVATNRRTNPNPANSLPHQQARFNGVAGPKPPPTMVRSPPRVKTSPPQAPWSAGGNSTLASLPMIGLDDALGGRRTYRTHRNYRHQSSRSKTTAHRRRRATAGATPTAAATPTTTTLALTTHTPTVTCQIQAYRVTCSTTTYASPSRAATPTDLTLTYSRVRVYLFTNCIYTGHVATSRLAEGHTPSLDQYTK